MGLQSAFSSRLAAAVPPSCELPFGSYLLLITTEFFVLQLISVFTFSSLRHTVS